MVDYGGPKFKVRWPEDASDADAKRACDDMFGAIMRAHNDMKNKVVEFVADWMRVHPGKQCEVVYYGMPKLEIGGAGGVFRQMVEIREVLPEFDDNVYWGE